MTTIEPAARKKQSRPRLRILLGFTIGLVLGCVVDAGIWIWAFSAAVTGSKTVAVPFIVSTEQHGQDITAVSGAGVFLLPVILAVLGAVIAFGIGAMRTRRHN